MRSPRCRRCAWWRAPRPSRSRAVAQDVRAIGAKLGVGTILTGSVRRSGNRIRITADLIDVATGFALWSERFDRELTDVFAVQDEITRAIVDTLARAAPRRGRPAGADAHGELQRVRVVPQGTLRVESAHGGLDATGPGTPPACHRGRSGVHAGAHRSRRLLPDARHLRRHVAGRRHAPRGRRRRTGAWRSSRRRRTRSPRAPRCARSIRFDWRGAEDDYVAALTAREQSPVTHQWYAMHLLALRGRPAEARAHVARARELDPLSPSIAASGGILRLYEGDAERAVHELGLVIGQYPAFGLAHYFLGLSLAELRRHAEAVGTLERAVLLSGASAETRSALGYAQARAGDTAAARDTLAALRRSAEDGYVSPVALAQVHVALQRARAGPRPARSRTGDARHRSRAGLGSPLVPTPPGASAVRRHTAGARGLTLWAGLRTHSWVAQQRRRTWERCPSASTWRISRECSRRRAGHACSCLECRWRHRARSRSSLKCLRTAPCRGPSPRRLRRGHSRGLR